MADWRQLIGRLLKSKEQEKDNPLISKFIKDETERRDKITAYADREIERCWKNHDRERKTFWGMVAVIVVPLVFLFGKTYFEIQRRITVAAEQASADAIRRAEVEVQKMETNLAFQAEAMSNKVAAEIIRVEKETKRQISEQFEKEEITALIRQEVQERIDKVADMMIQSNVSLQMQPLEAKLFTNLITLRTIISTATNTLTDLQTVSDFTIKSVLAENDDRRAYGWLQQLAATRTNKFAVEADAIITRIAGEYANKRPFLGLPDWESRTNRQSLSVAEIYRSMKRYPQLATFFVNVVADQTNITEEVRLTFLRHIYLIDSCNSLQAADAAATLVARRLNAKYNPPFRFTEIESALSEFTRTNHLFDVTGTNGNEVKFEIIHSSNTNQVVLNKVIGGSRLVVFALKANPIKAELQGRFIRYSTFITNNIDIVDVYGNLVTAKFRAWNGDLKKFEFKYLTESGSTPTAQLKMGPEMVDDNGILNRAELRQTNELP